MFDFLKKKIKDSINSIQKKLSKEEKSEVDAQSAPPTQEQTLPEKINEASKTTEPEKADTPRFSSNTEKQQHSDLAVEKQKGKHEKRHRLLSHKINSGDIDSLYKDIRDGLIENNVAVAVVEAIHRDLENNLVGEEVSILNNRTKIVDAMKKSISDIMLEYPVDKLLSEIKKKKPYTILFVGVNGAGKTTTLAKLIRFFMKNGFKMVVSASDTFRAASIEQLETHTKKLGVKIIKHNYGADPAAVAFDAIKHAKSDGSDLVLIDTAGRSDINKNLIEELKKIKRVSKPDLTIFVGDALTGNDVVNQARIFDKEVGIDATILSKADVDKKGGAVISISYVTKKPIMFLGTGQSYDDLTPFNKERTAEFLLE